MQCFHSYNSTVLSSGKTGSYSIVDLFFGLCVSLRRHGLIMQAKHFAQGIFMNHAKTF